VVKGCIGVGREGGDEAKDFGCVSSRSKHDHGCCGFGPFVAFGIVSAPVLVNLGKDIGHSYNEQGYQ